MRIGIDARSLLEAEPSGVSIYTSEIIRALSELVTDDTLHLFVSGARFPQSVRATLADLPHTSLHYLPWPNKVFHSLAMAGMAPTLDRLMGGVDVVFAPNLHFLPVHSAVPLVITVHDLSFHFYPHFLSRRRALWHTAVRPQHLFQRSRRLIAVSAVTATALEHTYQIPPERIVQIPSGAPTLPAAEPLPNVPEHYCVAIGTLEPRKNISTLIAAYLAYRRRRPDSHLHLVLLGSAGWKSQHLLHHIRRQPLIHYFGYVSPGQKIFTLQHAAALFYPSIYEGFGFPPLEALQVGTPVVVARAGALPAVLGQAVWYVNPYQQPELEFFLQMFDETPRRHPATHDERWQQWQWRTTAAKTLRVLHEAVY